MLLKGKMIGNAVPYGGIVEFSADDMILWISASMRYIKAGEKLPAKHQLLLEFADGSASAQWCKCGVVCFVSELVR